MSFNFYANMKFCAIVIAIASIVYAAPVVSGTPKGSVGVVGACSADDDCASGCCEKTQSICRGVLAMTPILQFCQDGRTPNFDGPSPKIVNINNSGAGASQGQEKATPPVGSGKAKGTQFITGPCSANDDCGSGCCETKQNVCRAKLALSGSESCKA